MGKFYCKNCKTFKSSSNKSRHEKLCHPPQNNIQNNIENNLPENSENNSEEEIEDENLRVIKNQSERIETLNEDLKETRCRLFNSQHQNRELKKLLSLMSIQINQKLNLFEKYQENENFGVAPNTQKNYLTAKNQYKKWCVGNNKHWISEESGNEYIRYLLKSDLCVGTVIKIKNQLNSVLSQDKITLKKIRRKYKAIPKFPMSIKDMEIYLAEQKKINFEDFIVQYFLIVFSVRISAAAGLKRKHLEYLDNEESENIFLPEVKISEIVQKNIKLAKDAKSILNEFLEGKKLDDEDYIFSAGKSDNINIRANTLTARINSKIISSEFLKSKNIKNYKLSSHMFRKCLPFNFYNEKNMKIIAECSEMLVHVSGSSATEVYLSK
jgi:hypothetical protein